MKKTTIFFALVIVSVLFFSAVVGIFAADEAEAPYSYASGTDIKNRENELVARLLKTEEDIQYYAYLDMESADKDIRPENLEARNIIIHRQGWVTEGRAEIIGSDGKVVRELPYFYDLFPEDWDIPVVSTAASGQ